MTTNPRDRIEDIDARLKELPKGTLTYKTINGKKQPYIRKRRWQGDQHLCQAG